MSRFGDWVARLVNAVPSDEMKGLQLIGEAWDVDADALAPSVLLRNLTSLVGTDATLFLEGGAHPPPLRQFLQLHQVDGVRIARGTIWPREPVFHLPATPELLHELAGLAERCAAPELCFHLHVYRDHTVLLEWHDAFTGTFRVSKTIPRDNLESFCSVLGLSF